MVLLEEDKKIYLEEERKKFNDLLLQVAYF